MDILFVSGGSVGHLAPAVAVWEELRQLRPDAYARFVCAERADEREFLRVRKLQAMPMPLPKRKLSLPIKIFRGVQRSLSLLKTLRPVVVMSKGGALSVPVCIAAKILHIPIVLHESDAVMGWSNWVIARIATKVCLGMEQTSFSMKTVFTGNPVRPIVRTGKKEEGLRITGFSGTKPVLLVYGGSQGATILNTWVKEHIDDLLEHCDIIHITGRSKESDISRPGYWASAFVQDDLAHLYAICDLAVCRAGAGTISELAATGIPAVLVPLPKLAHDHQTKNALQAAASGGCIVTPQDLMRDHLFLEVTRLLADSTKRTKMSASIRSLDVPSAARQIADTVLQCVAKPAHSA